MRPRRTPPKRSASGRRLPDFDTLWGLTSKRYAVVAALFVLSLITYLDRAAISSAKGPLAAELHLSDESMGAVFSAFALGYAIAQVPSGWFADRYGPRLALALVVAGWSIFTSLTGAVTGLGMLLMVRFIFGVAEAGAFPGSARAFYNWLPVRERGRANGIIFSGARLGGGLAFPLLAWLLESFGWRGAFLVLGLPGIAWAVVWYAWFRNHPPQALPPEPLHVESKMSFGEVLRSGGMMLAMLQYFASNFTFFICLSWMHPYLMQQYKLTQSEAARYAMAPLLFGASAQWVAGFLVDGLYRSRFRGWSRRAPAILGFGFAAAGVITVSMAETPLIAVIGFTIAAFGADMTISPSWAYCMDIAGKNSGAVTGSMNMIGNFGSFVSANAFPWLFRTTGSASTYFQIAALLNVASMVCWLWMRSKRKAGP